MLNAEKLDRVMDRFDAIQQELSSGVEGDEFIALSKGREQGRDDERHFGLVVSDKALVRAALEEMGVEIVSDRFLDFMDPWGNRIEIVGYRNIQFTKAPHVLRGMGLGDLEKSDSAIEELAAKGMAPDS